MIKKYPIILFFIFLFSAIQAQDTLKFNNRKYKWEVGIDIQSVFRGDPGTALVFKKRKTIGKLVPITYSNNLRYLIVLNGTHTINYKFKEEENIDIHFYTNNAIANSSAINEMLIGYERIDFFGKFNLYYGLDLGFNFSSYYPTRITYYLSNSNDYKYINDKLISFGPITIPFFGVKYRIAERFSVTAETGLRISYLFNKHSWQEEKLNPRETKLVSTEKYQSFNYNFDYLRFLTFNYHLRQY